jgi:succinoglycan biosynthesis protein ExoL
MQDRMPKVLSLLPLIGHPRDSKRIAMLQEAGCRVEALAFERDYHEGRLPTCPVTSLGRIPHGQYLRRAFRLLGALPKIRRALRRNDVAYASGADMALAGIVAGIGLGRPMVLEVGDIRRVQITKGWRGALARSLDRFIARHSRLLVVTAPGFVDGYYRVRLHEGIPSLVVENKLDEAAMPPPAASASKPPLRAPDGTRRPLRIGYFGVLRCDWSWRLLESMATDHPQDFAIVAAGYPMSPADLPERAKGLANAEYLGQYKSPQDLPAMYARVDVVWMCYPAPTETDPDWRWAQAICRSNRFYESCYFRTPTIALAGGADGQEVARLGIGPTLGDPSDDAVVQALRAITDGDLLGWRRNLDALPRSVFVYTDEAARLGRALVDIVQGRTIPGTDADPGSGRHT